MREKQKEREEEKEERCWRWKTRSFNARVSASTRGISLRSLVSSPVQVFLFLSVSYSYSCVQFIEHLHNGQRSKVPFSPPELVQDSV